MEADWITQIVAGFGPYLWNEATLSQFWKVEWLALVVAIFGLSLGIYNAWTQSKLRRVRIKVIPLSVEVIRQGTSSEFGSIQELPFRSPGIEVVNLSAFPITVADVGYEFRTGENYPLSRLDKGGRFNGHFWIFDKLPQRLEARSSLRVALWDKDEEYLKGKRIQRCYAITECHTSAYGRNPSLQETAKRLAKDMDIFEPVQEIDSPTK